MAVIKERARAAFCAAVLTGAIVYDRIPAAALDRFVSTAGHDPSNTCLSPTDPCLTLAHAADQAASGDVIKVTGGKYRDHVTVGPGHCCSPPSLVGVTFSGGWSSDFSTRDPHSHVTEVQGRGSDGRRNAAFQIETQLDQVVDLTIDGLTLRHGSGGLAAATSGTSSLVVTILDSRIVENKRGEFGSGIHAAAAGKSSISLSLRDTTIAFNSTTGPSGNAGGGIQTFAGNSATISLSLQNCVVARNVAPANPIAARPAEGGGIDLDTDPFASTQLSLQSCTIVKNTAVPRPLPRVAAHGGGVFVGGRGATKVVLTDTILWGNTANLGKDLYVSQEGTVSVDADHSDIGERLVPGAGFNDLGGNTSVDPALTPSLHLKPTSPMIDVGTCVAAPVADFEGDPRPTGAGCDVGADEFVP